MLPAKPTTSAQRDPDSNMLTVNPGSWWRFVGEAEEFNRYTIPDHGLVLMVSEARVVDGELHTVVVSYHPLWGTGSTRFLVDDFISKFTPEPDGAAVRAQELQQIMDEIGVVTGRLNSEPPAEQLRTLISEQKQKSESAQTEGAPKPAALGANVPAALLPSQDIAAAQARLEGQLAEMNARTTWIEVQTKEMKGLMETAGRFQMEKANQTLAQISDVTKKSQDLLKQVHSMRLFLGEDISVTELVSGASADKSEPLTFLQRMLFLDEEIMIQSVQDGGFDYRDMQDLGSILQANPALVDRILPYQRSVAITRIRRHTDLPNTSAKFTIQEVMALIAEQNANERIQVLIRDGGRVVMIQADETTSKAERLFPSRQEIEKIFTGGFSSSRQITPGDLNYTDARAKHDDRALFYKRFLIMFWGLHEREGLFGDFMPKGQNWLAEDVHAGHFRFIHDEENVLSDGWPSVNEFIEQKNQGLTSGSRIAVQWGDELLSQDNAPGMYTGLNGYRVDPRRVARPKSRADVCVTFRKGVGLAVHCKGMRQAAEYDAPETEKTFTVKLTKVREFARQEDGEVHEYVDHWGFSSTLCLDDVTLAELDHYIASRMNRRFYRSYFLMFTEARKVLLAERDRIAAALDDLEQTTGQPRELVEQAMRLWRTSKKWALPEKPAHINAIRRIIIALGGGIDLPDSENILKIDVLGNGDVTVTEDVPDGTVPAIPGIPQPYVREKRYAVTQTGKLSTLKSETVKVAGELFPEKAVTIATPAQAQHDRKVQAGRRLAYNGLRTKEALDGLQEIFTQEHGDRITSFIGQLQKPNEEFLATMLHEALRKNIDEKHDFVQEFCLAVPLGLATYRKEKRDYSAGVILASINVVEMAYAFGLKREASHWVSRIYKRPSDRLASLAKLEKVTPALSLVGKRSLPDLLSTSLHMPGQSLAIPRGDGLDQKDFRTWVAAECHPGISIFNKSEDKEAQRTKEIMGLYKDVDIQTIEEGEKAIQYVVNSRLQS